MYKHGVIAMKAWPFHTGHEHLIQTALNQCNKVSVMVVWGAGQDIDGDVRASWVQQTFPQVKVYSVADIFVDDNNPAESKMWAYYTRDIIQEDFDVVFSSEPYGEWWAKELSILYGCTINFVCVDPHRTYLPISGTEIRRDPYVNWQYINRYARLHYLKRVLVVGAESVGKTTLCRKLAQLYGTHYAPEYGRIYAERFKNIEDMPQEQRRVIFGDIITKQPMLERAIEKEARMICFYDTDLYTTALFYEQWQQNRVGDRLHQTILAAAQKNDHYDLVLVLDSDVPIVYDGQREQTQKTRDNVTKQLIDHYHQKHIVYVLRGDWEEREARAIDAVNTLFIRSKATIPQPIYPITYVDTNDIFYPV